MKERRNLSIFLQMESWEVDGHVAQWNTGEYGHVGEQEGGEGTKTTCQPWWQQQAFGCVPEGCG